MRFTRVLQALRVTQALLENQDLRVPKAHRVREVSKVNPDLRETQVLKALRETQAPRDLREFKVNKAQKVRLERQAQKVIQAHKALRESRVKQDLKGLRESRVKLEHKGLKEIPEIQVSI